MKSTLLFLGTGASAGTPMIGCKCPVCTSNEPRNQRLRPSTLITCGKQKILIDSGPDFRTQALKFGIDSLSGVILTHTHFDHIAGLDELRAFYLHTEKKLPVLVSQATLEELQFRFSYLFKEKKWGISLSAQLDFEVLPEKRGEISFLGLPISYCTYTQGGMEVNGFRFGTLAYILDIRHFDETIFEDLKGVETLVLSAIHEKPSPMHFTVLEAAEFARKVGAKKTWLSHISHHLDHEKGNRLLPEGMALAYDGLEIEFEYD